MKPEYVSQLCDLAIAIAYFSIPVEIVYYLIKLKVKMDIRYKVISILFVLFITLCGTSHMCNYMSYGIWMVVVSKALTSVVSLITAAIMIKLVPEALRVPLYTHVLETSLKEQVEDLQEANLKTRTAIQERNVFMQFLCHELRNPLFNITSNVDFLLGTKLTTEQRNFTESILMSTELMTNIADDVQDVSALEAGRLHFDIKAINLWSICEATIQQCTPRATAKDIALELKLDHQVQQYVMSDPIKLHRMLLNLVSNGIKFTKYGSVVLNVKTIEKTSTTSTISFEVTDTGIGVENARLGTIFTPYTNASSGDYQDGSGLGLAITKNIIEVFGGTINVESQVGVGSCFTVKICFKHATRREAAKAAQTPIDQIQLQSDFRLLVTEDNMINRKIILMILDQLGISADTARDGQECVEKIGYDSTYHMVLMDVQMPRKNGYEATRELRKMGYNKPIVALTANALDGEREKAIEAGMDDFVTKPITKPQMAGILSKFLPGWSPLQAASPITPTRFMVISNQSPRSEPVSHTGSPYSRAIQSSHSETEPLCMLKKDVLA